MAGDATIIGVARAMIKFTGLGADQNWGADSHASCSSRVISAPRQFPATDHWRPATAVWTVGPFRPSLVRGDSTRNAPLTHLHQPGKGSNVTRIRSWIGAGKNAISLSERWRDDLFDCQVQAIRPATTSVFREAGCTGFTVRHTATPAQLCPVGKVGKHLRQPAAVDVFHLTGVNIVSIRSVLCHLCGKAKHTPRARRLQFRTGNRLTRASGET